MQTSYAVATAPFRDVDPKAVSLLPRILDRTREANLGSQGDVSSMPFVKQGKDRGLAAAEKIEESIVYMTRNLNRPLQVSVLAALINVSPSHYFALFKRHTGCAPIDYFTRLRMEKARCLLDTTTASVKEVAAALGYDDPFYFSRVFKSVNQLAPSNYRVKRSAEFKFAEHSPCKS
jgi:transcriptional regulator GlxA family with amidase domain